MVPADDKMDFSFSPDQQADLAVDRKRQQGHLPREIMADDVFRRGAPPIKAFDGFDLSGAESCCMAEYFIDVVRLPCL